VSSSLVIKADLHAYVDGRLDDKRRRAVVAYLAEDLDAAERVAASETQKTALHVLFDPVLYEPLPRRWRLLLNRGDVRLCGDC